MRARVGGKWGGRGERGREEVVASVFDTDVINLIRLMDDKQLYREAQKVHDRVSQDTL